jgi:uracil permease
MNWKNLLVMATILVLGMFSSQLSAMLGFTVGIPINETVQITGLSFAAIVGILLNAALNIKKA